MGTYAELLNNLEYLNLNQIKEDIDTYIDLITNREKTVVDALNDLTKLEIRLKEERAMNACVKVANFPFLKTVEDFEFGFQPTINQEKIKDLITLRFIEKKKIFYF